jgi:hypothetical protein
LDRFAIYPHAGSDPIWADDIRDGLRTAMKERP